ncbi:tetratricopeptide repeat protein, partial [Stenotrophomonas acidaminiphila]|uniref:tetratricopeptide repeat protein n=1 Tax=Stenotrophomonas acidaminiphila TaxID=128780 RepID=UPI00307DAA08
LWQHRLAGLAKAAGPPAGRRRDTRQVGAALPAPAVVPTPQPASDTPASNTPGVATPAPARSAPLPATAANDSAAPAIHIEVERRSGAAPADAGGDGRAVEQAVADVERAMAGGDLDNARQALARLDGLLSPESLTLLRMQAWVAHAGNDTDQAEALYRRIAERVPEDVNAGVNIALLDARRGDADAARARLARLSGRHPRSPQVARALAELDRGAP